MSEKPIPLAGKNRAEARCLIRGALKGANLPDSMLAEYPGRNEPVLLEQPAPRTGVLQEELVQDEHGTGRAKVKLHIVDFENSNEKDGLRLKLSEEEVEAYCTTLEDGETIAKYATVNLLYINDRWTIVLGGGGDCNNGGSPMFPGILLATLTQNSNHSATATVRLTDTNADVIARAWILNSGEVLGIGRRVWMTLYKGLYEIVSANCPVEE